MVGGLDEADLDHLPAIDPVGGPRHGPFNADLSGAHQPLHAERGVIAKMAHEEAVDADAVQVAFDGEFGGKGMRVVVHFSILHLSRLSRKCRRDCSQA